MGNLTIICLLFIAIALGCSTPQTNSGRTNQPVSKPSYVSSSESKIVADIPSLIQKNSDDFEKNFGKAISTVKTNDPGTTPGEIIDYKIPGVNASNTEGGLMVRFYKGKAVNIIVELPVPVKDLSDAFSQVGIDIKDAKPNKKTPLVDGWEYFLLNGQFFKSIVAHKLSKEEPQRFTSIQAEVDTAK